MESKAKFLGHAVHPVLIVFPLGLLLSGVIFDVLHIVRDDPVFAVVAYWMIVTGIVGGFIAAVFGYIDWHAIPMGTRAKVAGLYHAVSNSAALLLFIGSWWLRSDLPERPETLASVLAFAGAGFLLVGGWLGGELVERFGVGVEPDAHLDAPGSLSKEAKAHEIEQHL